MKVILKKDHDKLGAIGEAVNVKDGYAMNYLFPNNIAMKATEGNMKVLEELKKRRDTKMQKEFASAEQLGAELEKVQLDIKMKAGEDKKIYGSVTSQIISDALKEKGYDVDKKDIMLEENIKQLGLYTVNIKLMNKINTSVKVWIEKEEENAG